MPKRNAVRILHERYVNGDPRREAALQSARLHADIAQMIYDARTTAGLTQARLATLAGTTQSVISRLEDADYEGHSVSILNRLACALGLEVQVRMVEGASDA